MAGPIDTRQNPTKVNELAKSRSIEWFEKKLIANVPWRYKGAFRRVYPGFLQLTAFMTMNLDRHINAHIGQFRALACGDVVAAEAHTKFYDEYGAVMDLPAEFYLETVQRVFQDHDLPLGKLTWHGQKVRPEAIRRTALLTVEGERDDICAIGQTMAALDLCTGVRISQKRHHLQTGCRALRRVQRIALGAGGLSQGPRDDRGDEPLDAVSLPDIDRTGRRAGVMRRILFTHRQTRFMAAIALRMLPNDAAKPRPCPFLVISGAVIRMGGRTLLNGADLTIDPAAASAWSAATAPANPPCCAPLRASWRFDGGDIRLSSRARMATVRQEAPEGPMSLLDTVLQGDPERLALLAETETADPHRLAEVHERLVTIGADAAPRAPRPSWPVWASTKRPRRGRSRNSPAAGACASPWPPRCSPTLTCCCWTNRPTISTWKRRCGWNAGSPAFPAPRWSSRTTAACWIGRWRRSRISTRARSRSRPAASTNSSASAPSGRCSRTERPNASPRSGRTSSRLSTAFATRPPKPGRRRPGSRRWSVCRRSKSVIEDAPTRFNFPEPAAHRAADPGAGARRYRLRQPTRILRNVSLTVDMDDRIALLGANGNGKSTLAKLLADRLAPLVGRGAARPEAEGRLLCSTPDRRTGCRRKTRSTTWRAPCPMRRRPSCVPSWLGSAWTPIAPKRRRQSVRRREGPPAAGAGDARRAAAADPGRADQPSGHRRARRSGEGAVGFPRRGAADHPRSASRRTGGRPSVAGRRWHGAAIRRRP